MSPIVKTNNEYKEDRALDLFNFFYTILISIKRNMFIFISIIVLFQILMVFYEKNSPSVKTVSILIKPLANFKIEYPLELNGVLKKYDSNIEVLLFEQVAALTEDKNFLSAIDSYLVSLTSVGSDINNQSILEIRDSINFNNNQLSFSYSGNVLDDNDLINIKKELVSLIITSINDEVASILMNMYISASNKLEKSISTTLFQYKKEIVEIENKIIKEKGKINSIISLRLNDLKKNYEIAKKMNYEFPEYEVINNIELPLTSSKDFLNFKDMEYPLFFYGTRVLKSEISFIENIKINSIPSIALLRLNLAEKIKESKNNLFVTNFVELSSDLEFIENIKSIYDSDKDNIKPISYDLSQIEVIKSNIFRSLPNHLIALILGLLFGALISYVREDIFSKGIEFK